MNKTQSSVANLSYSDLHDRAKAAEGHIDRIGELIPLTTLTEDERRATPKFRHGEADALSCVLDAADEVPASFAVLADKDGGVDAELFETDFLRGTLLRVALLDGLAGNLEDLARDLRDTQLVLGNKARTVVLAAYEIAKVLAKHDEAVRAKLAPAIDFYASPARHAARTRERMKAAANVNGSQGSADAAPTRAGAMTPSQALVRVTLDALPGTADGLSSAE
jgi:hypothetical protein